MTAALLLFAAAPLTTAAEPGAWSRVRNGGYALRGDASGPLTIVISRTRQRAYVYSGNALIAVSSVSTGRRGHSTPVGEFTILEKRIRHRSNRYSNAPMPYMQRLTWDGVAMHAGRLPGYPASHGCIRLPWGFARKLFAMTGTGAVVRIVDGDPELPRVEMASAAPPREAAIATAPSVRIVDAPPPVVLPVILRPPRPAAPAPVQLAAAEPRPSWLAQSAVDYVTWGTVVPGSRARRSTD